LKATVGQAFFATAYVGLAHRWQWSICLLGGTISFLAAGLILDSIDLPTFALVVIACERSR